MIWRDKHGNPVSRKTSDTVWPLSFEDRPRPEPEKAANVVQIKRKSA